MRNYDVLMFGWELPPYNSGGLGVACQGLTRSLAQMGTNIAFAMPRPLRDKQSYMTIINSPHQHMTITAINANVTYPYQTNRQYQSNFKHRHYDSIYDEAIQYANRAAEWSKNVSHQIVHAHDWMSFGAGIKASKTSGRPLVSHVHATEYDRTGGAVDPRIADLEYQGMHQSKHIIAVSNYTKEMIVNKYSVPKDKISVVHNGVDSADFEPIKVKQLFPHDHIVLYVGRLTFQKGVEYFISAAKEVLQYHPNTIFFIVGDGDMYQQHLIQAASQGVGHKMVFTGFLQGRKLRQIYQMADVFVMPSVSEPYGIVALEAIASGVPAIISKQSGVSETVSHAYQVDYWDSHHIAKHINAILSYPTLAKQQLQFAQEEVATLTWEKAAQKTLQIYSDLIN